MNSESIVQQIQYSDVLRQVYARNLRALQYSPLWNQMSDKWFAAKHRFDTWSMPFARVCLTLDAVIQTAQSAHEERRNARIGKTGEQFLDLLSEETVVLIGMLADAGEENLQLVRKLDSEKTTSGSLAAEMQNFVMKLEVLFMNGAVFGVHRSCFGIIGTTPHVVHQRGCKNTWWLAPCSTCVHCLLLLEEVCCMGSAHQRRCGHRISCL